MMRAIPILVVGWLMLAAPAQAVTPLDYTRTTLEQARTIVASSHSFCGSWTTSMRVPQGSSTNPSLANVRKW